MKLGTEERAGFVSAGQAVLIGVVVLMLSGCVSTKPADFMHEDFDANIIHNVQVLPVVDHRIDQSKKLKLDKWVHPLVENSLKGRGYSYDIHKDRSMVSWISRDMLEAPSPGFIAKLQPNNARWVLILVLEDSRSKFTFGSTGTADISGYAFDKQTGKLVWRDKEVGKMGQGGLAGMMIKGTMERDAIKQAVGKVLRTIPVHEE